MTDKSKPIRKCGRRRGGQPGNTNARKHGFYTSRISKEELEFVLKLLRQGKGSPEANAIQVKLFTALAGDPGNEHVLRESARMLYNIYRDRLHLDDTDAAYYKKVIRKTLEAIFRKAMQNAGTNQILEERIKAGPGKSTPRLTERIVAETTTWTILSASEEDPERP